MVRASIIRRFNLLILKAEDSNRSGGMVVQIKNYLFAEIMFMRGQERLYAVTEMSPRIITNLIFLKR